jgi:hypothetical protein
MRIFALFLLARVACAQMQVETIPAATALRLAVASPAASEALARNPGLALVSTLRLENPADLRALTPLLARLPAGFAQTAPRALAAADPAESRAVVAALESAYEAAAPAALEQLRMRERETRSIEPGRTAAEAWRALAAEAAPLALYGPRLAARAKEVEAAAETAERSARAMAEAERTAQALASDPQAELERAALESKRWAGFAGLVDGARRTLHVSNAPADVRANLDAARDRGVRVTPLRAADSSRRRVVVDNRLLVEFDAEGRETGRTSAERGWILADGTRLARSDAGAAWASARAYLLRLPASQQERALGEMMMLGIMRVAKFLAGFIVAGILLLKLSPPLLVMPVLLAGTVGFMGSYLLSRRNDLLDQAARLGWTRAAEVKPDAAPTWETILGDTAWDPARPYHARLDEALTPLQHAKIPADALASLLSRLGGPVWRPYLREAHLGLVWRQLASPDPLAVALAAQFLSDAGAFSLMAYLESNPQEAALLSAYEAFFPKAARALRVSMSERGFLG